MTIKSIEIIYTPRDEKDPMRQSNVISAKIKTSKGAHGSCIEIPEEAAIEDVVAAANLMLAKSLQEAKR